jgi:hypothetical protein
MKKYNKYFNLIFFFVFLAFIPNFAKADSLGQRTNFFVDKDYSTSKVSQVSATFLRDFPKLYFYFDYDWWNKKTEKEKENINLILENLNSEFENNIYPTLTGKFGSEWTPGIDKDKKITVLFYPMVSDARGYIRNIDGYEKIIVPESNQKEMIYLNADIVDGPLLKDFLAHEFMHLITFNQKERRIGEKEDVWLNEARSEYVSTLLGYNDPEKEGNYLKRRLSIFIEKPSDSLTEWSGSTYDYGVVSMFTHYLVDNYGIEILVDSLKNSKVGIESLNEALKARGYKDNFSDIFTNWIIASYINDCSVGERYCYRNENLKSIHIIPFNNFLPVSGESTLSLGQTLSNWSAHWQKFSGTKNNLKIQFDGKGQDGVKVIYLTKDYFGKYEIKELILDSYIKGEVIIPNMGIDKSFAMVIPSIQRPTDEKLNYFYYITASAFDPNNGEQNNSVDNVNLPFAIDKPLNQMNREELLIVLLKVIIYLVSQGKLTF